MKLKSILALIALSIIISVSTCETSSAQSRRNTPQRNNRNQPAKVVTNQRTAAELSRLLVSKKYTFKAERMLSGLLGGNKSLTPGYHMRVTSSTVLAELPFMGRMTTSAYGSASDNPMSFGGKVRSYRIVTYPKGGDMSVITFEVKPTRGNNYYTVRLEVQPNGSSTLTISQKYGDSQSYYGYIDSI